MADLESQRDALAALHIEYLNWVSSGIHTALNQSVEVLLGMPIPAYVNATIDRICGVAPPRGVFYLAKTHGDPAAMVGLSYLRDGVAEVKRLYVRPEYRGRRFGEACLRRVLQDARTFGYSQVMLDTAPFMYSARRLYKRCGFTPCGPYPEVETPMELHASWVFMVCDLEELALVT